MLWSHRVVEVYTLWADLARFEATSVQVPASILIVPLTAS